MQRTADDPQTEPKGRRPLFWAIAALTAALGVAVVGAIFTGNDIGFVVGSVEGAQTSSSGFLEQIGRQFPLGVAFVAGVVASVNPCGFAMLPAYLGLYLGDNAQSQSHDLVSRFQHGVVVGLAVTLGFVLMFAVVGLPIGLGARGVVGVFPWAGLVVGTALAVLGAYLLSGGNLYNSFAMRLSTRFGDPRSTNIRGYFVFGLAYATASLSCSLPIFLALVGGSFTASSALDSLLQFLLYGFGMGSVMLVITVSMALFKGAVVRRLRKVLPYVGTASAVILLVVGSFIVYYWLTAGGLLEQIKGAS